VAEVAQETEDAQDAEAAASALETAPTPVAKELVGERRRQPRGVYGRSMTALCGEATRIVLGRDLSVGGMRIERREGFGLGTRLRLSLYGDSGGEPVRLQARVTRDDGAHGMLLSFENVEPEAGARLGRIVDSLPQIERLGAREDGGCILAATEAADSAEPGEGGGS
jgi:hypothetical protein